MVSDKAFIFRMCIPHGKTFYMVPLSESSLLVKAKYQGHILPPPPKKKNAVMGAAACHKHSLIEH